MELSLEKILWVLIFIDSVSIRGQAKYSTSFEHLSNANPNAPKSKRLVIGWRGSFDTLNPFTPKGLSPLLLNSLVFQSLGQQTLDDPITHYSQWGHRHDNNPVLLHRTLNFTMIMT